MSFHFDRIKDIDDYTKSIVHGFVHSSQKLFHKEQTTYYTISDLIISVIIVYYYQNEYFAKYTDDIIVNKTKNILRSTLWESRSIFGDIKIDKHTYCNKFVRKFMVLNCSEEVMVAIGVNASEDENTIGLFDNPRYHNLNHSFYSYDSFWGHTNRNHIKMDINGEIMI